MKLTETTIRNLTEKGASRWTNGAADRLYLNDAAKEIVGLETEHYNSGNIRSATLKGEKISNSRARRISDVICSAYIDLNTGKLMKSNFYGLGRCESLNLLSEALDNLLLEAAEREAAEAAVGGPLTDAEWATARAAKLV